MFVNSSVFLLHNYKQLPKLPDLIKNAGLSWINQTVATPAFHNEFASFDNL